MILSLFFCSFHTVIPQDTKPLFKSPNLDKDLIPLSFKSMEKDLIINFKRHMTEAQSGKVTGEHCNKLCMKILEGSASFFSL